MALIASGFTGTVDTADWARMAVDAGTPYAVAGEEDYKVTAVAGQDRTVRVAEGRAWAYGVEVLNDAPVTVQLPAPTSGTRWHVIILRRRWTNSSVAILPLLGGSAKAISANREDEPGTGIDDQPLAYVQVTAGSTAVTAIEDLRAYASKVISSASLDGLFPKPYTEAVVGGIRWRYEPNGASYGWVNATERDKPTKVLTVRPADGKVSAPTEGVVVSASVPGAGRQVQVEGVLRLSQEQAGGNVTVRATINGVTMSEAFGPFAVSEGQEVIIPFQALSTSSANNATVPIVLRAKSTGGVLNIRAGSRMVVTSE